jgi:hypothetical protein
MLVLFNDAVTTSEFMYSQMGWKDTNEYLVGRDFEEGSNGLFQVTVLSFAWKDHEKYSE